MADSIDGKGMRHLAIVAHQDDDLLFMHTDLRKIIDRGGSLRIVYLTASDSGSVAYANDREHGVQCAYWSAVDAAGFAAVADRLLEQARPPGPTSELTWRQRCAGLMRTCLTGNTVSTWRQRGARLVRTFLPERTVAAFRRRYFDLMWTYFPGNTAPTWRRRHADLMRTYLAENPIWKTVEQDAHNPMKRVLALTGREGVTLQFLRVSIFEQFDIGTSWRTPLYNLERGLGLDEQPAQVAPIFDVDHKCSYTRAQLVGMLQGIIARYRPTAIHCQSPDAPALVGWPLRSPYRHDHPDHIATAQLVREAALLAGYEAKIVQHVCYPSAALRTNVSAKESGDAKSVFQVYARFDHGYGDDALMTDAAWLRRLESAWAQRCHYVQRPRTPGGVTVTRGGQPVLFVTGESTSAAHYITDTGASHPAWTALGGRFPGRTAPFRFTDGRLGVLGVSGDSTLYLRAQGLDGGWRDWQSLDGPVESDPAMTTLGDGRVAAVFRGPDAQLRFAHEDTPNRGWIARWKVIRPESAAGVGRPAVACVEGKWLVVSLLSDGTVESLFGDPDALGRTDAGAAAWAKVPLRPLPIDTELAVLTLPDNRVRLYGAGPSRAVWFADFDPATRLWTDAVQVNGTDDGAGVRFAVAHAADLGPVLVQLLQSGDVRLITGASVASLGANTLSPPGVAALLGVAAAGPDAVTVYVRGVCSDQTVYARTVRAHSLDPWRTLGTLTERGAAPFSATGAVTRLTRAS